MDAEAVQVAALLQSAQCGNRQAADQLLQLVYTELQRQAEALFLRERGDHTLEPAALIHEAYLRLVKTDAVDWAGRTHFFRAAAQTMRRVLLDYARGKLALKRGGACHPLTLSSHMAVGSDSPIDNAALSEALEQLAEIGPRACQVVELRFFAGMTEAEVAKALEISERTVRSEWAWARTWLRRQLSGGSTVDGSSPTTTS